MAPTFLKYNPMNNQQFLKMFDETKKKKLDLIMLLKNAQKLLSIIQDRRRPNAENIDANNDKNEGGGNLSATASNLSTTPAEGK